MTNYNDTDAVDILHVYMIYIYVHLNFFCSFLLQYPKSDFPKRFTNSHIAPVSNYMLVSKCVVTGQPVFIYESQYFFRCSISTFLLCIVSPDYKLYKTLKAVVPNILDL